MEALNILIRDARFWVAVLLLVRTTLFYLVPTFPEAIWGALDALVAVILAVLAGNNVVQTKRATRALAAKDAAAAKTN